MTTTIEELLSLLKGVRKTPSGWQALCPAHDDSNASLSIALKADGKKLLKCHAGCSAELITTAINLRMADLFDKPLEKKPKKKVYTGTTRKETPSVYHNSDGTYRFESVRVDVPGKSKTFYVRVHGEKGFNGVEPCLYNLHKISQAIVNEETIFIPEGEKQCDNLEKIGLLGTTNPLGAGKWHDSYSDALTFANVVVLPDNDTPGENHGKQVATSLLSTVKSVKILHLPDLPEKGDVSDWLEKGGTKEKLLELVNDAPYHTAPVKKKEIYYYDKDRKEYLFQNQRCWLSLTETQFKKNLTALGYNAKRMRGDKLSEVDNKLIDLREHNDIDYFGSLAGYSKGYYQIGDKRLLIPDGPKIIYPKPGDYKLIYSIIDGLLTEESDNTQINYFLMWLKIAYESLVAKTFRPGQMLVLAGERDCGKSFLQKIITEILGGRSARPYKYMTEKTEFNSDLFLAEHLMIEDEISLVDIRSRRAFGSQIKQFTANDEHRCRPMYRPALTLKPFWRITQSLNDEPENLMSLPVIDESISDKMIILRAYKKPFPMPTAKTTDRVKFWNAICAQIPALLNLLCKTEIPEEMQADRYGIRYYQNQYILAEISDLAPEKRLLDLIDMCLFATDAMSITEEYELTAHELQTRLLSDTSIQYEARKLLTYNTTCGTYLGRLAKKSKRIEYIRTSEKRTWKIKRK